MAAQNSEVDESEGRMPFGDYIREVRLSCGMTGAKAARALKIKPQKLSDIESNRRHTKNVPLDLIQKFSELYKVPIADIIRATAAPIVMRRTLAHLMVELEPAARLSELLCEQLVKRCASYNAEDERLAVELFTQVKNVRVLVGAIKYRQVTTKTGKPPIFKE